MATDMKTASDIGSEGLRALFSLVDGLFGERSTDDNRPPPGPWTPIVRDVFSRSNHLFGPLPDPWLLAGLNPQPLPPRWALITALAEAAIARAELVADVGAALGGEQAGPAYIQRLTDDLCPPPLSISLPKKRWPAPPPPRPDELVITGSDLFIISTAFENAARETPHARLAETFMDAAKTLGEVGAEQITVSSQRPGGIGG